RRLKSLELEHLRSVFSSEAEMINDWRNACAYMTLLIIEGQINLARVDPTSYPRLEATWLRRVKELKAYYIWEQHPDDSHEQNYHRASNAIRAEFLTRKASSVEDFEPIRSYIQDRYLRAGNAGMLDEEKQTAHNLIAGKAYRIYRVRGDHNVKTNWFRARLY